ncbi:hypothetical protein Sjap_014634 [Stephania japonica]|uniref:Uncharacterized protein n=1 Tax=Stephania japonica TaxID=461633 RepID=A0AAP0NQ54_9MAGN
MDHQEERAVMINNHDHDHLPTTNSSSPPLITTRLTVEEVIEDHVGSFGFSQLLHVFLVSIAWTFDSQNTLVTIFTDAQPSWACKGGGTWCSVSGPTGPGSICGAEPGSWEWAGGSGGSTVAEWGLVCERKFLAGLPACLFFIGSLLVPNSGVTKGSSGEREYGSLWSASWAARRMLLMMAAGFGVGFVYYGIQLNVENLSFNLYFTVALNALMEIPAVFLGSVLLSFMNRRTLLAWSAYVAGVSCLLCGVFAGKSRSGENKLRGSWPQLGAEAVGFMAASTAFDVMYIYCVELFPTNTRNIAVSLLRQALMLGAAIAPILVVVGRLSPSFSFLVFGCLAILSGILMYWLPETRNAPLYETLEQQEEEEKLDNSWGSDEAELELSKQ